MTRFIEVKMRVSLDDPGKLLLKAATSHTATPAKPPKKWNARDQRALDRMTRERAEDRARER